MFFTVQKFKLNFVREMGCTSNYSRDMGQAQPAFYVINYSAHIFYNATIIFKTRQHHKKSRQMKWTFKKPAFIAV